MICTKAIVDVNAVAEAVAEATVAMGVKIAAADVKAFTELAESHGDMITAAEAKERLRWEFEFAVANEAEGWRGSGDAAPPQGKQHRLRSRTKKKKKKKR